MGNSSEFLSMQVRDSHSFSLSLSLYVFSPSMKEILILSQPPLQIENLSVRPLPQSLTSRDVFDVFDFGFRSRDGSSGWLSTLTASQIHRLVKIRRSL